ncbi:toxin VasX, partial [Thioalkalivibrio sp. ALR17-21]|uniref:toxin VasX n=1 Tax=Thioalkalivibrio sp. ALR17-21 TaxID=1269813 RepID=UPI0004628CEB
MSQGTPNNIACEGSKLFIQVMGREHPDGQRLEIVDSRTRDPIDAFGDADTESLEDPVSELHQWCWPEERRQERADAQLVIEREDGGDMHVPLLEQLFHTSRRMRLQENIIQPVLPMALWNELGRDQRHALPLRAGFLYIFLGGRLWRELEVGPDDEAGHLRLRDIDLADHRDNDGNWQDDRRPAAGVALEELWLPRQASGRRLSRELRMAFSEVQWSAARLRHLEADDTARSRRCRQVGFSQSRWPSPGSLYPLEDATPMGPRIPLAETRTAQPQVFLRELDGKAMQRLHERAGREADELDDPAEAGEAVHEGTAAPVPYADESDTLYLQAAARLQVTHERLAESDPEIEPPDALLWEGFEPVDDSLEPARERDIPGLVLPDPLFDLRHALSGCRSSLEYLRRIHARAAGEPFFECAALVNQAILPSEHAGGEPNPLHGFADRADLAPDGELHRVLRTRQRRLAREQLATFQTRLHAQLLEPDSVAALADLFSLEGSDYLGAYALAADLLEALREAPEQADPLHTTPADSGLHSPRRFVIDLLRGPGALHAMLFPDEDASPLDQPLVLPEDEPNPGNGHVRLRALARLADAAPPEEADDVQLPETAMLAAFARTEEFPLSRELKRWAGAVDLVIGRIAEHAALLAEQGAAGAMALPMARLARAALPNELGGVVATERGRVGSGQVLLGVRDPGGDLVNGLTDAERKATRDGPRAAARHAFEGAVREASGRVLTPEHTRRLTDAAEKAGQMHLAVLVADRDSNAARVARRVRAQASVADAADTLRLPYLIMAIEAFNLRQEVRALRDQTEATQTMSGFATAMYDLAVASAKAVEFHGERHNRLQQLRAEVISRHLPLGDALVRSQVSFISELGARLKGTITVVNFFGFVGGVASAALLGRDALTRFDQGNTAAGTALALAAASTLVVAGSVLVKTSPLWLGLGPVGWIALGIALAATLAATLFSDTEIEQWLALGPFGPRNTDAQPWSHDPQAAYERLVTLLANIRIRVEPVSEVTAHSLLRHSAAHPPALEPDSAG